MALVPNLPPGTPNLVNPAVTPTWAFTPNTSATATVRIMNTGRNPVYVGGSQVTQSTGFPVPPGGKAVELIGVTQTLYCLSGVTGLTIAATMSSSAVTAGTTAITLATTVPTGLAAGTTIAVGNTAGSWEAQVVATTTASSQITFANPLVQDHGGSLIIYTATAAPAQVQVVAGVL
jgi:hypothetical protein